MKRKIPITPHGIKCTYIIRTRKFPLRLGVPNISPIGVSAFLVLKFKREYMNPLVRINALRFYLLFESCLKFLSLPIKNVYMLRPQHDKTEIPEIHVVTELHSAIR